MHLMKERIERKMQRIKQRSATIKEKIEMPLTRDAELSAIKDSSFPVRESNLKTTLQSALRWLHRRTEETVTVDLISRIDNGVPEITHIVDFTDRVKLDGAEYYLVSNQISFTPRKLIQKLNLIRWY